MDNLEDRQREMRERNAQEKRQKRIIQRETVVSHDSPELVRLQKQISQLQLQVSALQDENNRLRQQKTIVVERSSGQGRSNSDSVKEQQHNFFKYSNIRRY